MNKGNQTWKLSAQARLVSSDELVIRTHELIFLSHGDRDVARVGAEGAAAPPPFR